MVLWGAALLLALQSQAEGKAAVPAPQASASAIAAPPGSSKETAIKVKSVSDEYAWLKAHDLRSSQQALIIGADRHPYDVMTAIDKDEVSRQVWFDVQSFFGKGLGL